MPNGARMNDRFGLPISTSSSAAADHYLEGLDLLLSQNFGPEAGFQKAIDADEGFAMAHAGMAWVAMMRGTASEAKDGIAKAQSLSEGISGREKAEIEAIDLWINNKGIQSLGVIRDHLKEYPKDVLMLRLAQRLFMQGCHSAGVPNFPDELFALCQSIAKHCEDDWAFLGSYAFAHHETGRLDEAFNLASKSLEMYPLNAVASHSVTHVYFEKGDAASGGGFLGNWLEGFDKRASYHVHLSWHLALFGTGYGPVQERPGPVRDRHTPICSVQDRCVTGRQRLPDVAVGALRRHTPAQTLGGSSRPGPARCRESGASLPRRSRRPGPSRRQATRKPWRKLSMPCGRQPKGATFSSRR